ncbi:UNVERIFIED_CONTAM: hypothetical protein K2H54_061804 [Gekko kuhli]
MFWRTWGPDPLPVRLERAPGSRRAGVPWLVPPPDPLPQRAGRIGSDSAEKDRGAETGEQAEQGNGSSGDSGTVNLRDDDCVEPFALQDDDSGALCPAERTVKVCSRVLLLQEIPLLFKRIAEALMKSPLLVSKAWHKGKNRISLPPELKPGSSFILHGAILKSE